MFEAARSGVFTVASHANATRVVVNVVDPQYSDINRSRFAGAPAAAAAVPSFPRFAFEPWVALLAIAVALLAVEWLAYARYRIL